MMTEPALDRTNTAGPQPQVTELLVVRARQRDAHAFEELYRQHHRRVYALGKLRPGEPVEVRFRRGRESRTVEITPEAAAPTQRF